MISGNVTFQKDKDTTCTTRITSPLSLMERHYKRKNATFKVKHIFQTTLVSQQPLAEGFEPCNLA